MCPHVLLVEVLDCHELQSIPRLTLDGPPDLEIESGDALEFVTVEHFDKKHVRTHICEVQLLLRSTYELKVGGCHDNFVKARNMLAQ